MKKLYFKYGAMGSSKSAQALMAAFNYNQKGYSVLLIKPKIDNREGYKDKHVISSRIGLERECEVFSREDNLYDFVKARGGVDVVIVDEVQFCSREQIDELKQLTMENIVVLCYGLLTNFKTELFEGSRRLVELAESLQEIKCVCRCGAKATCNARIIGKRVVTDGAEIQIGGDESYESMCYSCYKKYQKEDL